MLLARASYMRLVLLALMFATPVLLLSSTLLLLDVSLYWVLFINWWFKPLYELPILIYLSQSIFGQTTSIKAVMAEARSKIPALLRSYLTLSRLSPSRSLTSPVVFLEQLKGKARRSRVSVLTAETTRAYTLMVAWLNVESIAYYALLSSVLVLLPSGYSSSEIWNLFEGDVSGLSTLFVALFLLLPTLIAALVAPMYVGAGFLLYINRRMRLEAWDIEHQFQALETRHRKKSSLGPTKSSVSILAWLSFLSLSIMLASTPVSTAFAQDNPIPRVADVRAEVDTIYDSDDFGSVKKVRKLRFIPTEKNARSSPSSELLLDIVQAIMAISRLVVYVAAGAILILVIWALLRFSPASWRINRRPKLESLDVEHHPLTRSLPADIVAHALAALNANNPREAISLLYRGALATVMRRHDLSIPASATEAECQQIVSLCNNQTQTQSFNTITHKWSQTAYANYNPTQPETLELIDLWKSDFSPITPSDNSGATT